jgi:hypothetical protein
MSLVPIGFYEVIAIALVITVALFALIASCLIFLRKKKPHVLTLEAIRVHELISLIISVCYFITVCVTLILLIVQNRNITLQTKFALESLEGNVYSTIMSQALAQDELFIKHPEMRPYFYQSKELSPDDPLHDKVLATAEYLLDFFDSLEKQMKNYPQLWIHEQKGWEANTIDMFSWSPVLCRYLEMQKEWYSESLCSLKIAGEKKRAEGFLRQRVTQK